MTTVHDLPDDIQPIAIRAVGLREQNVGLFKQLEDLGGGAEIAIPRVEHLIMYLVEVGVISERQRWDEAVAWEEHLRDQLKIAVGQLTVLRAEQKAEHERQQRLAKLRP